MKHQKRTKVEEEREPKDELKEMCLNLTPFADIWINLDLKNEQFLHAMKER